MGWLSLRLRYDACFWSFVYKILWCSKIWATDWNDPHTSYQGYLRCLTFWFWTPDASRSGSYKKKKWPSFILIIIGPPTLVGAGPIRSPSFILIIITYPFFSETALTIFMKLCMMLDNDKRKKSDEAGLSIKNLDHPKSPKIGSKWQFLNFFSKTALAILLKLAQNVELINSEHLAKTACQNLFPFLR